MDAMDETIIYEYTRAQALDDGVLVDVTDTAKAMGFRWPVAITEALMDTIQATGDPDGRLHDVLWMAYLAIKRKQGDGTVLHYRVTLPTASQHVQTMKLVMNRRG